MMLVSLQLAIRHWRHKPLRPTLCALLVLIGTALVLLADAGLTSALLSLTHDLQRFEGTTQVRVGPRVRAFDTALPPGLLPQIRALPQVAYAGGSTFGFVDVVIHGRVTPVRGRGVSLATAWKFHPENFAAGGPARSVDQVVLDARLARGFGLKTGAVMQVRKADGKIVHLRVAGVITPSPVQRFLQPPAVTLARRELGYLAGTTAHLRQIEIHLHHGVNIAGFIKMLRRRIGPAVAVHAAQQGPAALAHIQTAFSRALLLGAVLAGLSGAVLIAVMMGVGIQGRVREFGQLRCIGASRGQVLQTVLLEAALPGMLGTTAGLLVGWGASLWLLKHFSQVFTVCKIGSPALATAALTGLVATALGALVPVFLAWRIGPMRAVVIAGHQVSLRRIWAVAGVGVLALGLQIGLWQIPDPVSRFNAYVLAGGPLIFLGFILLAPLLTVMLERPLGGLLARLWWIRPELLKGAWSRRPWRSAAMVVALLMGIAFFTVMRSRAAGLMASWEFPPGMPDVFVFSPFKPLPAGRLKKLDKAIPGVAAASSVTAFWVQGIVGKGRTGSILFVAIQPRSFRRVVRVKLLDSRPGQTARAFADLANGRGVLIAAQARRKFNLATGRTITLGTLMGPVRFKVAGIAQVPEITIANRFLHAGRIFRKVASMAVVGSQQEARRYFGVVGLNTVMVDVKPGFKGMAVMLAVKKFLAKPQHASLLGSLLALPEAQLHGISIGQLKRNLNAIIERVMEALSIAGLGVLVAASVGVALLLMASVRVRRQELGILRALGAGRWQLCRMILAETSLLIIAACILGTGQGIYLAFMGTCIDHLIAGFNSRLVVAWGAVGVCCLATALLALLAAWWPASRATYEAARALIASGRE